MKHTHITTQKHAREWQLLVTDTSGMLPHSNPYCSTIRTVPRQLPKRFHTQQAHGASHPPLTGSSRSSVPIVQMWVWKPGL